MASSRPDPGLPATRAQWEAEADRWLLTARGHAEGDGALIRPPGPTSHSGPRSDGIEGFARSFLLAAARLAGAADGDPHGHARWYADGLTAAMAPQGPGRWPEAVGAADYPGAGITQPAVEAANLAFGLALCREHVWDRLESGTRDRLTAWLAHHAKLRVWRSNWLLFPAMAEAFLHSVGVEVPDGQGARNVAEVESWYLGDGWYNDGPPDGPGRNIDHYNAWVIHPFLWQWYRLRGDTEPAWRVERHLERLSDFARSHATLFAPDGAPLHLGRSLTYRHAVLGGLWTAALAGVDPLPPGRLRALAGNTLRYFTRLGVTGGRPPALGWTGRQFLPAVQGYSGPGSPYFAAMGFLGLAAGPDHPVWSAPAADPDPRPQGPRSTAIPAVGWLVQHGGPEGIVRVVNHGSDHATSPDDLGDPHYAKFAYSTHTAPGTGPAWADHGWTDGADGHLALTDDWGRATLRGRIMGSRSGPGYAASWHLPRLAPSGRPLPGSRVVTASVVHGLYEVRCHLVTAPAGWRVREGGHALAAAAGPTAAGCTPAPAGPLAWACADGIHSVVAGLHGYDADGAAVVRHRGANALGDDSATPVLSGPAAAGEGAVGVHVALHVLTRDPRCDHRTWPSAAEAVRVAVDATRVTTRWTDGPAVTLDLADVFPPAP